jgi:hypothetical protein
MSLAIGRNLVVVLVVVAFGLVFVPTADAISDAQQCEQSGGTYEKVQGVSTCTTVNEPPNQPNSGGVSKTEEDQQKGSFKSSHPEEEENCVNNNGGAHCK